MLKSVTHQAPQTLDHGTALRSASRNKHLILAEMDGHAGTGFMAAFVAWVKTRRGSSSFASFGNGSSGHLGFELLKKSAQLDMVHVPYKGAAPAMTDLLGGQVDAMLTDLPQAVESIKAGKIKALAIASDTRSSLLPNVPTFAQVGQANFHSQSWYGLVMRSGTPTTQDWMWWAVLRPSLVGI